MSHRHCESSTQTQALALGRQSATRRTMRRTRALWRETGASNGQRAGSATSVVFPAFPSAVAEAPARGRTYSPFEADPTTVSTPNKVRRPAQKRPISNSHPSENGGNVINGGPTFYAWRIRGGRSPTLAPKTATPETLHREPGAQQRERRRLRHAGRMRERAHNIRHARTLLPNDEPVRQLLRRQAAGVR